MKDHEYTIKVVEWGTEEKRLEFAFNNHDDLFSIIGRLETKYGLPPETAAQFGTGLKLFADAVRKNKDKEPFSSLAPLLGDIMKIVKGGGKEAA